MIGGLATNAPSVLAGVKSPVKPSVFCKGQADNLISVLISPLTTVVTLGRSPCPFLVTRGRVSGLGLGGRPWAATHAGVGLCTHSSGPSLLGRGPGFGPDPGWVSGRGWGPARRCTYLIPAKPIAKSSTKVVAELGGRWLGPSPPWNKPLGGHSGIYIGQCISAPELRDGLHRGV